MTLKLKDIPMMMTTSLLDAKPYNYVKVQDLRAALLAVVEGCENIPDWADGDEEEKCKGYEGIDKCDRCRWILDWVGGV